MIKGENQSLRVLIVDSTRSYGGSFESSLTLARHLNGVAGIRAGLVSAQPRDVIRSRISRDLPFFRLAHPEPDELPAYVNARIPLGTEVLRRGNLLSALRLALLARRFGCRVLHLNNLLTRQFHGVIAARLGRMRCVCSHRGFEWPSSLAARLEKNIDRHVPCSASIEADLLDKGIELGKIVTIPNGVDTAIFSPDVTPLDFQRTFGIPPGKKIVAIFGRLTPWKGHDIFMIAAKKVLSRFPEAHALIVGGPTPEDPNFDGRLKVMSSAYGISSRITFTGYRRDIPAIMRACHVVVQCSIKPEPFGLAVLEAMACGIPVVAAANGGPMEMIRDGIEGHLFPTGEANFLEEKIVAVLSNSESASKLGKAARERVMQFYSADQIAARHATLYRNLPGI